MLLEKVLVLSPAYASCCYCKVIGPELASSNDLGGRWLIEVEALNLIVSLSSYEVVFPADQS